MNETSLAVQPAITSDSLAALLDRVAKDPSIDLAKVEKFLELAERMHDRKAKSEYDQAMNAAQGELRPIARDQSNPQTRSKYASYEQIDLAIRPVYTSHGFAMSFGSKASPATDHVIVTCRVSHRAGHSEYVEVDMPADGKGARGNDMQTKTHATGSALSYGKRYLATLIWNLSFGESDDDGNAAGAIPRQKPADRFYRESVTTTKPAKAADVLPQEPKVATTATREWMISNLNQFPLNGLLEYMKAKGLGDSLSGWPLDRVPTSKPLLGALVSEIEAFLKSSELPLDEPTTEERPEAFWDAVITVPPRGSRKKEYMQNPDTIGSLYELAKTDEEARKRLFGLANNYVPEPWTGKDGQVHEPSHDDWECRDALDQFKEWEENKHKGQ